MDKLPADYQQLAAEEGRIWSENARRYTEEIPPDWRFMRREYNYRVVYRREIEQLLNAIQPAQRILEIGSNKGWLALEMARCGAHVDACDIAEGALQIAQDYYDVVRQTEQIRGTLNYFKADINTWEFPTARYDWIILRGILHHTLQVREALLNIRQALKPTGTLWASDPIDPSPANALIAGGLMMLLPTQIPYREKIGHLFRVRGQAMRRMQAAIETEGASPFEGIGRSEKPLDVIRDLFTITHFEEKAAFAGFLSAELKLPYQIGLGIMRVLWGLDCLSIKFNLLPGLNYTVYAQPPSLDQL
jgi:2-polyprenyl-3-methyl-5-hydroxy-6-metoxy-1,4-benzoquinol methylase